MIHKTFAEFADRAPDEDFPLIQELLAFHMLCPVSCTFVRDDPSGSLTLGFLPSALHWSRQMEWPWAIRNSHLEPHHRVLDVGGGWSVLKYALAKRCKQVISLEIDPEFIAKTEPSIQKIGTGNIIQVQGDLRNIPFPAESFDNVYCLSVLEHVPKDHIIGLRELIRVLKPGGILILTMDVVLEGELGSDGDFYIGKDEAAILLKAIGIEKLDNGRMFVASLNEGKQKVCVVMVCYFKMGVMV